MDSFVEKVIGRKLFDDFVESETSEYNTNNCANSKWLEIVKEGTGESPRDLVRFRGSPHTFYKPRRPTDELGFYTKRLPITNNYAKVVNHRKILGPRNRPAVYRPTLKTIREDKVLIFPRVRSWDFTTHRPVRPINKQPTAVQRTRSAEPAPRRRMMSFNVSEMRQIRPDLFSLIKPARPTTDDEEEVFENCCDAITFAGCLTIAFYRLLSCARRRLRGRQN